jgi:hypothetical protein
MNGAPRPALWPTIAFIIGAIMDILLKASEIAQIVTGSAAVGVAAIALVFSIRQNRQIHDENGIRDRRIFNS